MNNARFHHAPTGADTQTQYSYPLDAITTSNKIQKIHLKRVKIAYHGNTNVQHEKVPLGVTQAREADF